MSAPWVTPQDALKSQPHALNGAIFLNGINGILTAGGIIPASIRQQRRNGSLVKFYKYDGDFFDDLFFKFIRCF
jgi:hypothetical protein